MNISKQTEKNTGAIAREILDLARNTLLLHLRFMDMAICSLKLREYRGTITVDEETISFDPEFVIARYRADKSMLPRLYLHMVFHCVFHHIPEETPVDVRLWNLACDITVENIIDGMNLGSICCGTGANEKRQLEKLKTKVSTITAEKLYRYFAEEELPEQEIERLEVSFLADDHRGWYRDGGARTVITTYSAGDSYIEEESDEGELAFGSGESEEGGVQKKKDKWRDIAEMMLMDLESFAKRQGDTAGDMLQNLRE